MHAGARDADTLPFSRQAKQSRTCEPSHELSAATFTFPFFAEIEFSVGTGYLQVRNTPVPTYASSFSDADVERAASVVQNYAFSQTAVDRYKNQMIPRARKAYEMYAKKYQEIASAYPQVLIAQRTLMQLEVSYINALETFATSSVSLQSYLLTDGLEAPSQPGAIDQPVREVNIPFQMGTSPQER